VTKDRVTVIGDKQVVGAGKRTSNKPKRSTRMPKAALAKQAAALRSAGYSTSLIAQELGKSQRYIFDLLKHANQLGYDTMVYTIPDVLPHSQLKDDQKKMIEESADGFERFFNAYSGRTLQPVHKDWVHVALSTKRTLINCPPRHAKSTIFSVWFPLWLVARDRNIQILICSQTDKLAKKFTNEIAYHLAYNRDLNADFGRFRPEFGDWPWRPNSGELLVDGRTREVKSGDLTIQVRGAGQQILGMEANWIVVDDAVSRQNTRSETEREKLSEWFHGDVMSRLEPNGTTLVIGQRLHLYDLYGELASEKLTRVPGTPKRWNHINFPAIKDWGKEETLWPNKWGFEELMDVYADVGYQNFEAMYQQNPLPDADRLVKDVWLYGDEEHRGCLDHDRGLNHVVVEEGVGPRLRSRVLALDPSPTKLAGLIVADVPFGDGGFECEILDIRHEPMNVRKMLSEIYRVLRDYAPVDYFVFEQNAAQRWLLQDPEMDRIRAKTMVIPHTTNRNKADPELGVSSLALDFEYGRVRLPYGDVEGRNASQLLIDEAVSYPQGLSDDVLMALWFIKYNKARLLPRAQIEQKWDWSKVGRGFRPPRRLLGR
jgi:hypothetical protein